jgi:FixJ family two-component response regulator
MRHHLISADKQTADTVTYNESAPRVYVLVESLDYDNALTMSLQSKGIIVDTYFRSEQVLASFDRSRAGCILLLLEESGVRSAKELLTDLKSSVESLCLSAPIIVYMNYPNLPAALNYLRYGADDIIGKFTRDKSELTDVILSWLEKSERKRQRLNSKYEAKQLFKQLSPPVQETARLVYQGLTNNDIAAASGRKLRTVENRRSMIMKTMKAKSFADLIRKLGLAMEDVPVLG